MFEKSPGGMPALRRRWFAAGAVMLALFAVAALAFASSSVAHSRPFHGQRSHTPSPPAAKPTIVLVHGAWADGSSWKRVVERLQDRGYTVDVPPNPLRGLASDAAYISSYLATITGPVVLVGHSYGGAVITNTATSAPNVKLLVYIDAFAPDQGENVLQLSTAQPGSALAADPTTVFNAVPYSGAPAGDVDLYDNVIPPAEQRSMAARAGSHTVEVPAGHLSMLSRPDDVTRVIVDAARSLH